jgi:Type ISP C-terminal specificity domain/N-6 DNA Methylase
VSVQEYVQEVNRLVSRGIHNEHPFREALSRLLRSTTNGVTVINDPGATEHGNPDLHVVRDRITIGYVETKALAVDLDAFEGTEQFSRYLAGFANLLVTNYSEFRWYVSHVSEPNLRVTLKRAVGATDYTISGEKARGLGRLLQAFVQCEAEQSRTAASLARQLAAEARIIRDVVGDILETHEGDRLLQQQLRAFRTVLIPDLNSSDFADMYAQTICYGLFAARCAHPDEPNFSRFTAPALLPLSNPFLGNVFEDIAGRNLHQRVARHVDRLCLLLRTTDMHRIIEEFETTGGLDDPVVHFYETFLKEYDAEVRRDRGVFYTPKPVVTFITKSIDALLKEEFSVRQGLADRSVVTRHGESLHRVQILDPATGTGTFLLGVIELIRNNFTRQRGLWPAYVREHLLPRLFGFEMLMAPYTIAHLKLGMAIVGSGFSFRENERIGVFLTNSLEDTSNVVRRLPFENFLTEEAAAANEIKQERPIMVVLGNPPYSVRTGNRGPHARALVERYKTVDGTPIREGGTLALQRVIENDYVKFVAFAQEQLERSGEGIIGLITSNGYLDSPVLAGFRESLFRSFNSIYIINLHGYARSSEDGDQNIFPQIGEGVAIMLLIRHAGAEAREATVTYSSFRGPRAEKRAWLDANSVLDIHTERVRPRSPDYRFVPEDRAKRRRYDQFVSLDDIFLTRRGAIVTARDSFVVGFTPEEVLERVRTFKNSRGSLEDATEAVGANWRGDWARGKAEEAKRWLRTARNLPSFIKPITYRPFDTRYIFFDDRFLDTPCRAVMDNLASGDNLALLYGRSVRYGVPDQFFVSKHLAEAKSAEASRQCYAAHLFTISDDLVSDRQPNLKPEFLRTIRRFWRRELSTEEVFGYIYAILFSAEFRSEFADLICRDVAKIPIVQDVDRAKRLAGLGLELVQLHTEPESADIITTFDIDSDRCRLERPDERWQDAGDGTLNLFLNEDQFIGDVPETVFQFRIGGYAVIDKWLNAREAAGYELSVADVEHIQHVISALHRTGTVVNSIDRIVRRLL